MSKPRAENISELTLIARENVHALMKQHKIKDIKTLHEFVAEQLTVDEALNYNTLVTGFNIKGPRANPSPTTMAKLEKAFGISEGSLIKMKPGSKLNEKKPGKVQVLSKVDLDQVSFQAQIGKTKIETTITGQVAREILELVVLGDKT